MDIDELAAQFRYYAKVTKDYVLQKWRRFVDFLESKRMERQNSGFNIIMSMRCAKYVVVLISVLNVLISLFVITVGTSIYLAHESFYNLWFDLQLITIFVIFCGVTFTVIAVFGMVGAFKESVLRIKIYGVVLMALFVLQLIISISAFCLVATGSSRYHSFNMVHRLMRNYYDNTNIAHKMDWIQKTFECCGVGGPSDWKNIDNIHFEFDIDNLSYTTPEIHNIEPPKYITPASCCTRQSGYQNMICEEYYENGCTMYVSEFLSEAILIFGTSVLVIGVVQFLGVVSAFTLARLIRRTRSYMHIQKWNSQYKKAFDIPTYVNYTPLNIGDN